MEFQTNHIQLCVAGNFSSIPLSLACLSLKFHHFLPIIVKVTRQLAVGSGNYSSQHNHYSKKS